MATIQGQQIKGKGLAPGEEIKGSSIKGVQPITPTTTPVGQAIGGASEDQAKMAGTPAQTTKSLLDRVDAPTTTEDRIEQEEIARQPSQEEIDATTKYDQTIAAYPALTQLDEQFREEVINGLMAQSSELGPSLSTETVSSLFPEDTPSTVIAAFVEELREFDTVKDGTNQILKFLQEATSVKSSGNQEIRAIFDKYNLDVSQASKLLDPTESLMTTLLENSKTEVTLEQVINATGRIPISVPALPGQEKPTEEEYLETLLGSGWRQMTWTQVKEALLNMQASFTDVYQVRAAKDNLALPLWARNMAVETLKTLGMQGALRAEEKINNIELQITDGDSITIGDQTYTIEEIVDNPEFAKTVVGALNDEAQLKALIEDPDTKEFGLWISANAEALRSEYQYYTAGDTAAQDPFSAVTGDAVGDIDYDSFFEDETGTEVTTLTGEGISTQFIFNTVGRGDVTAEEMEQVRAAWAYREKVTNTLSTAGIPNETLAMLGLDLTSMRPVRETSELSFILENVDPETSKLTEADRVKFIEFVKAAGTVAGSKTRDEEGFKVSNYVNDYTWRLLKGADPKDYPALLEFQATTNPEDIVGADGKITQTYLSDAMPEGFTVSQILGTGETTTGIEETILVWSPADNKYIEQSLSTVKVQPLVKRGLTRNLKPFKRSLFVGELAWLDTDGDGIIDEDAPQKIADAAANGDLITAAKLTASFKEAVGMVKDNLNLQIENAKQQAENQTKAVSAAEEIGGTIEGTFKGEKETTTTTKSVDFGFGIKYEKSGFEEPLNKLVDENPGGISRRQMDTVIADLNEGATPTEVLTRLAREGTSPENIEKIANTLKEVREPKLPDNWKSQLVPRSTANIKHDWDVQFGENTMNNWVNGTGTATLSVHTFTGASTSRGRYVDVSLPNLEEMEWPSEEAKIKAHAAIASGNIEIKVLPAEIGSAERDFDVEILIIEPDGTRSPLVYIPASDGAGWSDPTDPTSTPTLFGPGIT